VRLGAALLILAAPSCSAFWSSAGEVAASATAPATGAVIGASVAGPPGAFAGAVAGDLVDQAISSKVEADGAQEAAQAAHRQSADQLSSVLLELTGNPEAARYFREQAAEVAAEKASGVFDNLLSIILCLVAAYLAKQLWSRRQQDKRYMRRCDG